MRKLIIPFLIAALLVGVFAVAVDAQTFYQKFENIWAQTLTTTGNATIGGNLSVVGTTSFAATSSEDLVATDDATIGDDATVSGTLTVYESAVVVGVLGVSGDFNVTDDVVVADSLTVTGTTGLIGNVDVTGNLEAIDHIGNSGQEYWFPGDAVSVADGGTITPTTALVELTAAGAVGTSLSNPCTEGQVVMFVNTAAQTITITDTGTIRLAGDWAGGQYDTLTVSCVGVAWHEMARAAN